MIYMNELKALPKTRSCKKFISASTILMYPVAICMILDLGCMWKIVKGSPLMALPAGLTAGILCLLQIVFAKKLKYNPVNLLKLLAIIVFFIIYVFATRYNIERFLIGFVGVFLCYYLYAIYLYGTKRIGVFLRCFSNVVLIIAIISLFFWVFGSLLNILPGRHLTTYWWADQNRITYTYFHLYYENPIQNRDSLIVKNLGVFAEGPGYSSFLLYALLIEFGIKNTEKNKANNRWKIIVMTIALLSSFSTKGIIAVMLIYFLDYMTGRNKKKSSVRIKIIIGGILLILLIIAVRIILVDKMDTGSWIYRTDDLQAEFKAWMNHPLFGNGYDNVDSIVQYHKVWRDNQGLSMGIPIILAYGGIVFLGFYIYAIINSYKGIFFTNNRKVWIITIALLLYNLVISNSGYSDIYIFLLASAYAMPLVKKKKRVKHYIEIEDY